MVQPEVEEDETVFQPLSKPNSHIKRKNFKDDVKKKNQHILGAQKPKTNNFIDNKTFQMETLL